MRSPAYARETSFMKRPSVSEPVGKTEAGEESRSREAGYLGDQVATQREYVEYGCAVVPLLGVPQVAADGKLPVGGGGEMPVGCTNSVTSPDRLICSEIVFVHPTRRFSYERRRVELWGAAHKPPQQPGLPNTLPPGIAPETGVVGLEE
jgi:hypothetical protein